MVDSHVKGIFIDSLQESTGGVFVRLGYQGWVLRQSGTLTILHFLRCRAHHGAEMEALFG